ncbi:MAG: hypothetical protein JG776_589 [Caloramator sp.]|jgi:hypothetical protein|nr:hypothetical protein [Caloramator sp.]
MKKVFKINAVFLLIILLTTLISNVPSIKTFSTINNKKVYAAKISPVGLLTNKYTTVLNIQMKKGLRL